MPTVTENKMEKQGELIKYIVIHFGRLEGTVAVQLVHLAIFGYVH